MRRSVGSTLFDEHASVLAHWFAGGVRDRTLVCFDAHLDLQCISGTRLDRLKDCRDSNAVSQLMKPHHWFPDSNSISKNGYSYSIEDFLYAAKHLGIINRLVWVAPPHIPIFDPVGAIEQLRQSDGIDLAALSSLRLVHDPSTSTQWIQAVLYDLPIIICREATLAFLELPVDSLVDIDIDYFVELPSERIGRSPLKTVQRLLDLELQFEEVTISRSVLSGYTPADLAWIAESIAEVFASENWREPSSRLSCEDFPLSEPENATELLRRLSRYAARGIEPTQNEFEALARWTQTLIDPTDSVQTGLVAAGLGLLCVAVDDIATAKTLCNKAAAAVGDHPELAFEIAKHNLQNGVFDEAAKYFTKAALDDKSRASAHHHLGVNGVVQFQKSQNPDVLLDAIVHLRSARTLAPTWSENLNLLSHACVLAGDGDASESYRTEMFAINQVCQHFIQQIEAAPHD